MAFTYPVVQHTWINADGTPSSGQVEFVLSTALTNSSITISPTPVTASLDQNGAISQPLASNVDAGTTPNSSFWTVVERILGAPQRTFSIQLPSASAGALYVDLGSLAPFVTPPEFA